MSRSLMILLVGFLAMPALALDLDVQDHELANGLRIVSLEKHDAPVVVFRIVYRVGARDEVPGKTGLAHALEHHMFKTTSQWKGEEFAEIVSRYGGMANADTSWDRTAYYEILASNHLELAVLLEAERMRNLRPTPEEFLAEMKVIKEERRVRYDNDPIGGLRLQLFQHAFQVHPYGRAVIGTMEDIAGLTLEDLMDFYRRFYHPGNAVAIVVGDFETPELLALMEKHFGPIPPGPEVVRRIPPEPPQIAERRFQSQGDVRMPTYIAGYRTPAAGHGDAPALTMLSYILSVGSRSRLRSALVESVDPVAIYAGGWYSEALDPFVFFMFGAPLMGIPPQTLEERLDGEVTRLQEEGITQEELDAARRKMEAFRIYDMQSSMELSEILCDAEVLGTYQDYLSNLERMELVTPEEILRVARTYLVPENRTVGWLVPGEEGATP